MLSRIPATVNTFVRENLYGTNTYYGAEGRGQGRGAERVDPAGLDQAGEAALCAVGE